MVIVGNRHVSGRYDLSGDVSWRRSLCTEAILVLCVQRRSVSRVKRQSPEARDLVKFYHGSSINITPSATMRGASRDE
ncbi:hypothetical protein BaRGS_00040362 [Batillaria attramentaria]|uniref:Uncharacterized protein n=1 Tax=Batillaria attramentaria TaxID=370345 RepID=A0ABD0J0X3_9CAEN